MFIRIRTIKGRRYRYAEYRWREGRRVRSRSISLGAVGEKEESWLKRQLGHRYGMPDEDVMLERYNALCVKDAAQRQSHLDKLHDKYGLKLGPNISVPEEKTARNVSEQTATAVTAVAAEESLADEGEAEAQ